MKITIQKSLIGFASATLLAATLFSACKKKDNTEPEEELGSEVYVLSASPQGGGGQIVNLTSSVESGQTSISKGHEGYNFFSPQKIGNAIYVHSESGFYQKYTLNSEHTGLNLSEIPAKNGGEVIRQIGDGRAVITKGYHESGPVGFDILDLANFKVVHSGFFNLPKPSDTLAQDLGCPYPYNGKFYFPYSLYKPTSEQRLDTTYVAIYNATTFALEKVIKETRVQGLGSNEDIKPYVQGNFIYFLSQKKSIPGTPHKVLRINTTTDEFDDFEFVLTGHEDLFFYNLHDIGGGKALVLSYDEKITTPFIYEFWLIDITNKTFEKLNIPAASDLYYRYFLDIPGNKVAIAVNSSTGNFVYTYDKATGAIAKGVEYVGGKINELTGPLTK